MQAREAGMTLIELMVVVLIIGILMAISIPTFAAQRGKAQDRNAQAMLHSSLLAAKVIAADRQTLAGVTAASLETEEPAARFVAGSTPAQVVLHEVSMRAGGSGSGTWVLFATGSASGACLSLLAYAEGSARYQLATAPSCAADDFDPTSGSWGSGW